MKSADEIDEVLEAIGISNDGPGKTKMEVAQEIASDMLSNKKSATELDVGRKLFDAKEFRVITDAALQKGTITKLVADHNMLKSEGAIAVSELLAEMPLTSVNLQGAYLYSEGVTELASGVAASHSLESLDISQNFLNAEAVIALAPSIKRHPSLQKLDIRQNALGEEGAKPFGDILATNKSLTHLNLNSTWTGYAAIKEICEGLKTNRTLTDLDISDNPYGDDGAKYLAEMLKENHTLRRLNVSNKLYNKFSPISPKGIAMLADALAENEGLTELNLTHCALGIKDAAKPLVKALETNRNLIKLEGVDDPEVQARVQENRDAARDLADLLLMPNANLSMPVLDEIDARQAAIRSVLTEDKSMTRKNAAKLLDGFVTPPEQKWASRIAGETAAGQGQAR